MTWPIRSLHTEQQLFVYLDLRERLQCAVREGISIVDYHFGSLWQSSKDDFYQFSTLQGISICLTYAQDCKEPK